MDTHQRPPAIHGRASPRRKKDRGLQLRSLLTSHDNKRARHRTRRLGTAAHSNFSCNLQCISSRRIWANQRREVAEDLTETSRLREAKFQKSERLE